MQCDTWYGTRWLDTTKRTHPILNIEADLQFKRHAERQQFSETTWRQARVQHHFWKWSCPSVCLQCRCLGWCYNSWMSRNTLSLQSAQRQRVHRSSEGSWPEPATVLATLQMLVWRRDAGQAFEFAVRDKFEVNNFLQGAHSPCVYRHKVRLEELCFGMTRSPCERTSWEKSPDSVWSCPQFSEPVQLETVRVTDLSRGQCGRLSR